MFHYIEVEKNCNYRCAFCVRGEGTKPGVYLGVWEDRTESYIPLQEFIAKDIRDSSVVLSGGEPTCNPELYDILRYLKEPGRNNRVTLQTNAVLFSDESFARKMLPLINGFQIPCYGGTKEVYEASCGVEGSWELWNQALVNMGKYCNPRSSRMAVVVLTRINIDHLAETMAFINDHSIFTLGMFEALYYTGSALRNIDLVGITQTECLMKLHEALPQFRKPYDVHDFYPCIVDKLGYKVEDLGRCAIPESYLTKIGACKECKHPSCSGIQKKYLELFGDSEFTT